MTRIQKDTVSYFPHYADASERDTLTIIQNSFGNDGYAFWFKLLEKLCSSEGHYIDCNISIKWNLLIAKSNLSIEKGLLLVDMLASLGAIDPELWTFKIIWCQKLIDNVSIVYKNRKRELPPKPMIKNNCVFIGDINIYNSNPITTVEKGITTDESTQSRVENSRVDKIIVDKTITPIPPSENLSSSSELKNTFTIYEQEIGNLTPYISEQLKDAEIEYTPEWVVEAIKISSNTNHKSLRYIMGILEKCKLENHPPSRTNGKKPKDKTDPNYYKKGKYGKVVQS